VQVERDGSWADGGNGSESLELMQLPIAAKNDVYSILGHRPEPASTGFQGEQIGSDDRYYHSRKNHGNPP
jgi:hypothetical protein